MRILPAAPADLPACLAIYRHHVLTGIGSFEEAPPDAAEFTARHGAVTGAGLPWLVAVDEGPDGDGAVLGYAYASAYMARSAYRFTVQDSVYIAPDAMGRGVGKALLTAIVERCEALGFRQMIAIIGGSENVGSRALHRACGFAEVGVLPGVGLKFGRWLDSVLMRRPLGRGSDDVPTEPPAARVAATR